MKINKFVLLFFKKIFQMVIEFIRYCYFAVFKTGLKCQYLKQVKLPVPF